MFIPDMPDMPPQTVPMIIAQVNQEQTKGEKTLRSMGVCFPVSNQSNPESLTQNVLTPKGDAWNYYSLYENRKLSLQATVTVLENAKHGEIVDGGDGLFVYIPKNDYMGKDKTIFLVDFGDGQKVKVVYFIQSIDGYYPGNESFNAYCGKTGKAWKISANLDTIVNTVQHLPAYGAKIFI